MAGQLRPLTPAQEQYIRRESDKQPILAISLYLKICKFRVKRFMELENLPRLHKDHVARKRKDLTDAQKEFIQLHHEQLSNAEMARQLGCNHWTVGIYARSLRPVRKRGYQPPPVRIVTERPVRNPLPEPVYFFKGHFGLGV